MYIFQTCTGILSNIFNRRINSLLFNVASESMASGISYRHLCFVAALSTLLAFSTVLLCTRGQPQTDKRRVTEFVLLYGSWERH